MSTWKYLLPVLCVVLCAGVMLVIDHGELEGLGDDDHEHYVLADGTRDITGDILLTSTNDQQFRDENQTISSPFANTLELDSSGSVRHNISGAQQLRLVNDRLIMVHGEDPQIESAFDFSVVSGGSPELNFQIMGSNEMTLTFDGLDVANQVQAESFFSDGDIGGVAGTIGTTNVSVQSTIGSQATLNRLSVGNGPTNAQQWGWVKISDGTTTAWYPVWR